MNHHIKDTHSFFRVLETYSKSLESPIVFCDASSFHDCEDQEKKEKLLGIFQQIMPIEVYHMIKNDRWFTIVFDDYDNALDFCLDHFPTSKSECKDPDMYIQVELYNALGESMYLNK